MLPVVEKYTQHLKQPNNRYFTDFQDRLEADFLTAAFAEVEAKMVQAKSLEDWVAAIRHWNELQSHLQTHSALVELAFQCHTDDADVELEERRLRNEIDPVVERANAGLRDRVLGCEFLTELKRELGEQYFLVLKIAQESFNPKNIALETELNHILSDYTKLTGSATFELDGTTYPLPHYKKFSSSPDARIRRESFLSYSSWYLKNRDALEKIFDESIALRQKMAKELGYENFIRLGYQHMRRVDYGPEDVAGLREQILRHVVPLASRIHRKQAEMVGQEKISVSDLDFYPRWNTGSLKVKIPEQPETALGIYRKLSPRLGEHFESMIRLGLIDVEARNGKAPGAFCTDFADYRVPFVFLNSVDEAADVTTLLHESGHAFQAWESRDIPMLELRWPTLEACEVHSMSMEFLAYPYYEEFFTAEDAEKYRNRHLIDSILILPYIAMVDEFQHLVYGGQANGAEGRAEAWEALERKYFPEVDFSLVPVWRRQRWIRQLHIFKVPFYYIDYAIAQIGAWQLWMQSLEDRETAMQNYFDLCRLGGTLPLKSFFKAGKLQLPFESNILKELMDKIFKLYPQIA